MNRISKGIIAAVIDMAGLVSVQMIGNTATHVQTTLKPGIW